MDPKPKRVNSKASHTFTHVAALSDRCPKCKLKFSKRQIKVLYKEFVECQSCGHNFMAIDMDEIYKHI